MRCLEKELKAANQARLSSERIIAALDRRVAELSQYGAENRVLKLQLEENLDAWERGVMERPIASILRERGWRWFSLLDLA